MQCLSRPANLQRSAAQSCLMARLGDSDHIAACCSLLQQFRFVFDHATWESLPGLFSSLVRLGAMQLCLVEDRGIPGAPIIVAFCASIFVADGFCSEARSKLGPYLGLQIAHRFREGKLPTLDRKQIGVASSKAGVSVVTGFCSTRCESWPSERVFAVQGETG